MVLSLKARSHSFWFSLVLALSLLMFGCGGAPKEASRWDNAQKESTGKKTDKTDKTDDKGSTSTTETSKPSQAIPDKTDPSTVKPVAGSALNKFFPAAGDGFERVASQEKEGAAIYKLKKDGKDAAELSITDTANNPGAVDKFKSASDKIGGFPALEQGSTATAVLVANRFQVKAISKNPSFTKDNRKAWLSKFDLSGLSSLK
jgi:hypothetical protein